MSMSERRKMKSLMRDLLLFIPNPSFSSLYLIYVWTWGRKTQRGRRRQEGGKGSEKKKANNHHHRSGEEACKRSLDHFPNPTLNFPMPTLEFDLRIAVKLKPEPSNVEGKCPKEITTISSGRWSGSFGTGHVVVRRSFGFYKLDLSQSERCADMHDQAGGYDLGQARGFRPIRIVEGAFVMQTRDDPPAAYVYRPVYCL